MIDLLVVLPDLRARGAERSTVLLIRGLAERGLSVHLAVTRAEGPLRAELPPGVVVHELSRRGMAASLPALVGVMRRVRPKAVLSALTHANVATVAATGLAGLPGPLVVEHTVFSQVGSRGYRAAWAMAAAAAYRRAAGVVAVSVPVARDVSRAFRLPPGAVRVVPNPIDFARVDALAADTLDDDGGADGPPSAAPIVLAVGRLAAEKDHRLLFEAFGMLDRRDARLVVLGEGPERRALEALASAAPLAGRVFLPGHDRNPYRWMARAAALVISSRYEGLPTVAIEAAYLGLPVVAVDDGYGLKDALAGEPGITFVPDRRPSTLAAALADVLGPPDAEGRAGDGDARGATRGRGDQPARYGVGPVSARFAALLATGVPRTGSRRVPRAGSGGGHGGDGV